MSRETFSVDTQLFRELGDLLVRRDSTALAELIKNAYDADARNVLVAAHNLANPKKGWIQIVDDGVGMTVDEFRRGFLTIAGRLKTESGRKSRVFKRTYTGEKGIGRLAARKLAHQIIVESYAFNGRKDKNGELLADGDGFQATIDWDQIEKCTDLSEVAKSGSVMLTRRRSKAASSKAQTSIQLQPLRRKWTEKDINDFLGNLQTVQPIQSVISPLPPGYNGPFIFDELPVCGEGRNNEFEITYDGDFKDYEFQQTTNPSAASWVLEVHSDPKSSLVQYVIAPSSKQKEKFLKAKVFRRDFDTATLGPELKQPGFCARIFERFGGGKEAWDRGASGVKIYVEGFRVLPYGEPYDDWLNIDSDYRKRGHTPLPLLKGIRGAPKESRSDEMLHLRGNHAYMGVVALTKRGAGNLEILANREGFVESETFDGLRRIVRIGIDLMTRTRLAAEVNSERARSRYEESMQEASEDDFESPPSVNTLIRLNEEAVDSISLVRKAIQRGDYETAIEGLEEADTAFESSREIASEMRTEQAMLRVLATVGTQTAAFVHEVNWLIRAMRKVVDDLGIIREEYEHEGAVHRLLSKLHVDAIDLLHELERQAMYLTDVAGIPARRRRSRRPFYEGISSAQHLLRTAMERAGITMRQKLSPDLKTPAMFPAEVVAVFTNLLSNAVKAAGEEGKIEIRGREVKDETIIIVENTGKAINIKKGEIWFDPFESTTAQADAELGRGMGLGLTITRSILDEYGATIEFVQPHKGFATAIEMRFPK